MWPGSALLLGIDLQKDVRVLEAAYNDRRGVTTAFNLNLLTRINRELGADFALDGFRHDAFYNRRLNCIEMHLLSLARSTSVSAGRQSPLPRARASAPNARTNTMRRSSAPGCGAAG